MIDLKDAAPRTKDGEHQIVFTPGLYDNHDFHLRSGFEGRRLWELASVLESDRGRALADRHPHFLFEYDCVQDSDKIFHLVSNPHIGRISCDRKLSKPGFSEEEAPYEGDTLIPPFFPIFYTPEFVAKYIEEGTFESANAQLLLFKERSLIYMWPDSQNAITSSNIGASYYKGWQELFDEFPEMRRFSDENNRHGVGLVVTKLRKERLTLTEIRESKELMTGLESIALYHVLDALASASMFQKDFALCQRSPRDTFRNGHDQERTYASPDLTRRLADSAVALCKEYLSEMK